MNVHVRPGSHATCTECRRIAIQLADPRQTPEARRMLEEEAEEHRRTQLNQRIEYAKNQLKGERAKFDVMVGDENATLSLVIDCMGYGCCVSPMEWLSCAT